VNLQRQFTLFALLAFLPLTLAHADEACVKVDPLAAFRTYMLDHPRDFPSQPNQPEPDSTIEWIRGGLSDKLATLSEVTTSNPVVRWLGVEWQGPIGGILVIVDCQGKVLDGSSDGGVDEMRAGPMLPEIGATALVSVTDVTGTGILHKTIALYGIRYGKLLTLWSHDLEDSEFVSSSTSDYKVDYQVEFDASGTMIKVSGIEKIYPLVKQPDGSYDPGDKVGKVEHTNETFCWNPHKAYYGPCPKG
jgi:hypothetical protein